MNWDSIWGWGLRGVEIMKHCVRLNYWIACMIIVWK